MRPRSASTTNPVACAVEFHSVSKARVASTLIDTTLLAIRSRVTAQSGLPSTAAACWATCAFCSAAAGGGVVGDWTGSGVDGPCFAGSCTAAVVLAGGGSRASHRGERQRMRDSQSSLEQRIGLLKLGAHGAPGPVVYRPSRTSSQTVP